MTEPDDRFFRDELEPLARAIPRLDLRHAAATGQPWFATDLIGAERLDDRDVYLCGPPAMTDKARTIVTERGAVPTGVISERFVPTGAA